MYKSRPPRPISPLLTVLLEKDLGVTNTMDAQLSRPTVAVVSSTQQLISYRVLKRARYLQQALQMTYDHSWLLSCAHTVVSLVVLCMIDPSDKAVRFLAILVASA